MCATCALHFAIGVEVEVEGEFSKRETLLKYSPRDRHTGTRSLFVDIQVNFPKF